MRIMNWVGVEESTPFDKLPAGDYEKGEPRREEGARRRSFRKLDRNGNPTGAVLHSVVARELIEAHRTCHVDGAPAIWDGNRYASGWDAGRGEPQATTTPAQAGVNGLPNAVVSPIRSLSSRQASISCSKVPKIGSPVCCRSVPQVRTPS